MSVKVTLDVKVLRDYIANTGGKFTKFVKDGVEYGIYQEMGTSRMSAQPFMVPAVEAVRGGFEKAFMNQLKNDQVEAVVLKTAHDVERIAKQMAPVDTGALKNSIGVSDDA